MDTISAFLSDDHAHCDGLFADAEAAIAEGDWMRAEVAHQAFRLSMTRHFAMEEDVLFPAFESATGSSGGPTAVMRSEHQQMNALIDAMDRALRAQDADGFLGQSETLLWLMRQHNAKEETMLYPMSDRVLGAERLGLLASMGRM
jgi:hemerythrin-like domain-containing protein